jgi:hypothetical protein
MTRRRPFPWRRSAGAGQSRAPGVRTTRAWVWEDQLVMGKPPRGSARVRGACNGSCHGMGGSSQRSSPASGVPGARAGPGLRHLAHKLRGVDAMLTRGSRWPELQRKMAGGEILWRRRVGVRGEGCCRGSPGSWSPLIDAWRSCEGARGIREVRRLLAAKNCGGGVEYRRRPSARFPHGRARGRGGKTRGASWRGGEAAASLGRGWDAPERPAHNGAEALHGGASGRRS